MEHELLVFLLNLATQAVFKKSLKNTHFIMTTKQTLKIDIAHFETDQKVLVYR